MRRKAKKKSEKSKRDVIIILAAVVILTLGIFVLEKASITGFVILKEEKIYDDNLNLIVNESGNYVWNLRNLGNLQSVKATGAISRNGSAKVYIEKDDERFLIFDSTKQLFDVNVEVLPDYKKIFQGDELLIQIILFNLRGFGAVDVNVQYSIKDKVGNIVAAQEEVVAVETQAKFVRKLVIPSDLKSGTYVAFVEVTTPDGLVGTSSDLFEVTVGFEEEYPIQVKYALWGLVAVIVLIFITVFLLRSFKELKRKRKVIRIKEKIPQEKIQKLEKELAALEKAYKAKFISEASYIKNKERVERKLGKLKIEPKEQKSQEEVKKQKPVYEPKGLTKEKTASEIVEEVKKEDNKQSKNNKQI